MESFDDGQMPHKKKAQKKQSKKSDHKHQYELVERDEKFWFTHQRVCTICGKVYDRIRIEDNE